MCDGFKRRGVGFVLGILVVLAAGTSAFAAGQDAETPKYNVLFIMTDDLRPELGCYGVEGIMTPHIDKIADEGVRFDRAYCQYPVCNPSRNSILTGLQPHRTGSFGFKYNIRDLHPNIVTLPQYFMKHGYVTASAGKLFHGGKEDEASWNESLNPPPIKVPPGYTGPIKYCAESSDVIGVIKDDDRSHMDFKTTEKTIEYLKKYQDKPFFIGCGFIEPHSPITAPTEYYRWYEIEDMKLPVDFAPEPYVPAGFPRLSVPGRNADLFMDRKASPWEAKEMIRAYWASTSWIDINVGKIMKTLERLDLADKTIIVFWGDHGFHLGEKGKWAKHGSLWEVGTRVPFLIRVPGMKGNGQGCKRIVQSLDIYPTLADVCGLPIPKNLDGVSLKPLLENPDAAWDKPAYTVTGGQKNPHISVRVERWRYAEYNNGEKMLIDEENDPVESKNLADDPQYADVVAKLHNYIEELRKLTPESVGK